MNPGGVEWHRKETTHYLGGGAYVVVRRDFFGDWLVEEQDPFAGPIRLFEEITTRSEADALANLVAASRQIERGEVAT